MLLLGLAVTLLAAESAQAFEYHYNVKHINVTGGFTYAGTGDGAQESATAFQGMNHRPDRRAQANKGFLRYPPRHTLGVIGLIGTPDFYRKYQFEARGTYSAGLFSEPDIITCADDRQMKLSFGGRLGYNKKSEMVVVEWGLVFDPIGCTGDSAQFIVQPHFGDTGPCKGYLDERYPLKTFQEKEFELPISLTCDWAPSDADSASITASREAHIRWNGRVVMKRVG